MPINETTPIMLGAAFVLLIALLIIFWVINSARQRRARKAFLLQHGFVHTDTPDAALSESVQGLYQGPTLRKIRISNIFSRPLARGTLYIFDLEYRDRNEDSEVGHGLFGVRSSDLHMPYLHLMPHPAGSEIQVKATGFGRMMDWVLKQTGMELLDFPNPPAFAQRYIVLSRLDEEEALRSYLDYERMSHLAAAERNYEITGAGDFFTLRPARLNQTSKDQVITIGSADAAADQAEAQLEWQAGDAQKLLTWLS